MEFSKCSHPPFFSNIRSDFWMDYFYVKCSELEVEKTVSVSKVLCFEDFVL